MNPLPPNVDELVSAYLDGEAAPDEIAAVESNPELMQRVEELRAVAESLSGPLSAPDEAPAAQKEAHLGAALDLFDQLIAAGEFPEAEAASSTGPHLSAVPGAAEASTTDAGTRGAATSTAGSDEVVSFEAARERRRPRRFNTGVIAAAAAVLLLFVGLAALNFTRGTSSDDVATSEFDAARAADTGATDDGSDAAEMEAAFDEAMDDAADAMEESAESSDRAFDADDAAAAPAAEPDPAVGGAAGDSAPAAEEPVDQEEAMDDDSAAESANSDEDSAAFQLDEAEGDDSAADDLADDSAVDDGEAPDADSPVPAELGADLFLGEYRDVETLIDDLELLSDDELVARAEALEPGLFPGCQDEVAELDAQPGFTLVGRAMVGDLVVEIHRLDAEPSGNRSSDPEVELLVLDAIDCSTVATATPGG